RSPQPAGTGPLALTAARGHTCRQGGTGGRGRHPRRTGQAPTRPGHLTDRPLRHDGTGTPPSSPAPPALRRDGGAVTPGRGPSTPCWRPAAPAPAARPASAGGGSG